MKIDLDEISRKLEGADRSKQALTMLARFHSDLFLSLVP